MSTRITIDPIATSRRSERLFMQFMEPLGTTDASVDAGWDYVDQRWKDEFISVVKNLSPGCIRWGGIYSSYWKWREGIGPRDQRIPVQNLQWHGIESNQVGVHEIVDLCRAAGAEPLVAVNFAGDGRPNYVTPASGPSRAGDAEEAADLVTYCNDRDNATRRENGAAAPFDVRLWQIGNETSYPPAGKRFTEEENVRFYVEFARAMKKRDPSIELIGWGDAPRDEQGIWASSLLSEAGELVDYVAIHMMNQRPVVSDTILTGRDYMDDRPRAWYELNRIYDAVKSKLSGTVEAVRSSGHEAKIAITEGHLSLKPHNTNLLLYEWLAGLYSARIMNLYERHADRVEVATLADFFGNRWSVNAVMLGSPRQTPYLMPAGTIAKWFHKSSGTHAIPTPEQVSALDISGSRSEDTLFLHVVNTDLRTPVETTIRVNAPLSDNATIRTIAPDRLDAYVDSDHPDTFEPNEQTVSVSDEELRWSFPAASVTLMEIGLAEDQE